MINDELDNDDTPGGRDLGPTDDNTIAVGNITSSSGEERGGNAAGVTEAATPKVEEAALAAALRSLLSSHPSLSGLQLEQAAAALAALLPPSEAQVTPPAVDGLEQLDLGQAPQEPAQRAALSSPPLAPSQDARDVASNLPVTAAAVAASTPAASPSFPSGGPARAQAAAALRAPLEESEPTSLATAYFAPRTATETAGSAAAPSSAAPAPVLAPAAGTSRASTTHPWAPAEGRAAAEPAPDAYRSLSHDASDASDFEKSSSAAAQAATLKTTDLRLLHRRTSSNARAQTQS